MTGISLRRKVELIKLFSESYQLDRTEIETLLDFPFQSFKKEVEMLQNCDSKIFDVADPDFFQIHMRDQWSKKLLGILLEKLLDSCDGKISRTECDNLNVLLECVRFDMSQSKVSFLEQIGALSIDSCRTIALVFSQISQSESKLKAECAQLLDQFWGAFLSHEETQN